MFLWSPWCAHAVRKQGWHIHTRQHRQWFFWKLVLNQLFCVNNVKPLRCIIQAEIKGNLMEKEFIKFDCYGRIWINLVSIWWSCQNLYFGGKMRSESCFYITKNCVIYLSEDGFEFSFLGWSLLQQLNVRNKTKSPLKSHAAVTLWKHVKHSKDVKQNDKSKF